MQLYNKNNIDMFWINIGKNLSILFYLLPQNEKEKRCGHLITGFFLTWQGDTGLESPAYQFVMKKNIYPSANGAFQKALSNR